LCRRRAQTQRDRRQWIIVSAIIVSAMVDDAIISHAIIGAMRAGTRGPGSGYGIETPSARTGLRDAWAWADPAWT
jgi:hypothetical protein